MRAKTKHPVGSLPTTLRHPDSGPSMPGRYPNRVRAMVLDGSLPPVSTLTGIAQTRHPMRTFMAELLAVPGWLTPAAGRLPSDRR
jgi:pimeloyl-ACP methyl ester carboxylesterase